MSPLRHLALFVTESCNLACDYCFAANMEGRHVAEPVPRQAIDLMFAPGNEAEQVTITFWGGEPLLKFDLVRELVGYAKDAAARRGKRVDFAMPTNLTLLTDEMVDFFLAHGVSLSLSLDGEEAAQALRRTRAGGSSFPIIRKKLDLVRRRYGNRLPGVRMTVSPATAEHFYRNVRFFLDQGFRHVYFSPVLETEWSPAELLRYEEGQRELAAYWLDQLDLGRPPSFTSWDKALARREHVRRGQLDRERYVICGAGRRMLAVDIYGDIYPCHRFVFYDKTARVEALGNVASGLPRPERTAHFADLGVGRLQKPDEQCARCDAANDCFQICPAVNYALTGAVNVVHERLCRFTLLEKWVVDHLETAADGKPSFQDYLARLVKFYAPDTLSASISALFARFDDEDVGRLAERADGILDRLQKGRTALEPRGDRNEGSGM